MAALVNRRCKGHTLPVKEYNAKDLISDQDRAMCVSGGSKQLETETNTKVEPIPNQQADTAVYGNLAAPEPVYALIQVVEKMLGREDWKCVMQNIMLVHENDDFLFTIPNG